MPDRYCGKVPLNPIMLVIKIINLLNTSGQEICLVSNDVGIHLVGRNPSCDVVIDNPLVSNVHGMFVEREQVWYYLDLLPTNPSHLNNLEVKVNQHHPLKIRDTVCIGDFLLIVVNIKTAVAINPQGRNVRTNDTIPQLQEGTVYLQGSDGFGQDDSPVSDSLEFLMENYYQEYYHEGLSTLNPTLPRLEQNNDTRPIQTEVPVKVETSTIPLVVFSTSGKEIDHEGDESILALAEQQSIPIKSSCKRGICGVCKLKKLEGEVNYKVEPKALTAAQKKAGFVLACIAHPIGRVVVKA
ncbi:MAG: hypothetical protein RLZZ135_1468 [Cyanobacteriota bacterium]